MSRPPQQPRPINPGGRTYDSTTASSSHQGTSPIPSASEIPRSGPRFIGCFPDPQHSCIMGIKIEGCPLCAGKGGDLRTLLMCMYCQGRGVVGKKCQICIAAAEAQRRVMAEIEEEAKIGARQDAGRQTGPLEVQQQIQREQQERAQQEETKGKSRGKQKRKRGSGGSNDESEHAGSKARGPSNKR